MGKYDSPLDPVDQENSAEHESFSEQKTESWRSWFCRHSAQITKGAITTGLLVLVAGLGYWFGRRSSAGSNTSSPGNALVESTSALVSDATPTPVSLVGGADAGKPFNFENGKTTQKIEFGDAAAEQKNAAAMSSSSATSQRVSAKSAEGQNVETAVGTTAVNNLVVNGTIPVQLIQVGFPWIGGSIDMTELFGERVNITGFSQVAGDKVFPDWLQIAPNLVGSVPGFWAQGVTVSGNLAYVAAYQGLKIIDISNSSSPFVRSSVTGFGARGVTVSGNLAYVVTGGLKIIDISNSSSPFVRSNVPGFSASGVTVRGNLAYVAAATQGLKIVDISNSSNPFLVGPGVPGFDASGVIVRGNFAYVAAYDEGLKIVDINDGTHPSPKSNVTGFTARGVTVSDDFAYVIVEQTSINLGGLKIIDISDSAYPKVIEPGVPGLDANGITAKGNLVYVATENQGLQIIDVHDRTNPFLVGSGVPGFPANSVIISGNLAYVASDDGLKIIDVSQPNKPIIVGEVSGPIFDVAVSPANTVCMVGNDVLSVLDVTKYRFFGTPSKTDAGNYNIVVIATNPDGAQAQTKFTIRVEGGPILNRPLPPRIVLVGQPANFFITQGTFSDPNNDIVTYEAMLAHNQPLPSFLSFNPNSATFSGIPRAEDKGNYMVTIFASDRIVYPPTPANFTLVVQDPIPDQTFVVDRTDTKSLSIPPDSVFEGRMLTYGITLRNGSSLPSWLYFDATNRKLTGTPKGIAESTLSVQVTLNDTYGAAFFLFNLNVKRNTPPALTSTMPIQNLKAGEKVKFRVEANTFADVDDDLTYKASLDGAESWLSFDPKMQEFTGIPSGWSDAYPYVTRKYTITVTALDRLNASASGTFDLNLTGSSWQTLLTTTMAMFGALITSYGYTQKKYLLWDLFKKARYQRPLESLMIGDMGFAHRISFPAERIKSITVTTSHERLRAQRMSRRLKNTLSFFPILEEAVKDIQVRIFPCTSVYLLPWLFYDAEANMVKSVKGGPTAKEVGKDIKIQVRGTDNRIMEEFHIAVDNPQRECLVGSTHRRTTFFARAQELQFPPSVRDNGNSSSHHA